MTIEWIRFGIVAALLLLGVLVLFTGVLGVFRFRFVLNRMHCASIGDSLGLFLVLLALMIYFGFSWETAKLVFALIIMWLASPVAGHLVSKLEVATDPTLVEHTDIADKTKKEAQ